ncbi:MAG: FeoB-associated Cys-rich membrane protein [Oscillospiraceae bacterium]|nr:FeoB-associated Cys-rich membrane protein [Oscillospiraceae bacterium]
MENVILIIVLVLILGGAGFYVYKAKKSGKKCIGCPSGDHCGKCCSHCNHKCEETKK